MRACIITALVVLSPLVAAAEGANSKLDPSSRLSHVKTSIFAESALIDKETGRIFWEAGGSQSTLSKSLLTKFGLGQHSKATTLSLLLLLAVLGYFHQWLRHKLDESSLFGRLSSNRFSFLPALLLRYVVLSAPRFDTWFIIALVGLYFWEASTCKTLKYLSNPMESPEQIEQHIEHLRKQEPTVSWNFRSFHYEQSIWYRPKLMWRVVSGLFGLARNSEYQRVRTDNNTAPADDRQDLDLKRYTLWPFTRKRVTHHAQGSYEYKHVVDSTMVGLWQRAKSAVAFSTSSLSHGAPFAKLSLSKLLVLSDAKARQDYFNQQSKFIADHSVEDDFAEFSTKIEIAGYRPKVLAVRSGGVGNDDDVEAGRKRLSLKVVSFQFWFFTLLGLTVPYRIWFNQHCDEIRVTVVKETSAKVPTVSLVEGSRAWWSWTMDKSTPKTADGSSVEQKEGFRETMRQLALYSPKSSDSDPSRLIEPVKKMIRQLKGEESADQNDVEESTDEEADSRSLIVQEIKEAVATAKLLSLNETRTVTATTAVMAAEDVIDLDTAPDSDSESDDEVGSTPDEDTEESS